MVYTIKAIILENCSYSDAAFKLLQIHNINHEIVNVNQETKHLYKTDKIDTFPQLYMEREDRKGSLLLGGYDELKSTIDLFLHNKYNVNHVKEFMNKYNWSKKATLRLIQLINRSPD
jgi:hypothetical protein